jgi:hypothetical protein
MMSLCFQQQGLHEFVPMSVAIRGWMREFKSVSYAALWSLRFRGFRHQCCQLMGQSPHNAGFPG